MDSRLVVQANSSQIRHPCSNSDLLQAIHTLIQRQWDVQIMHVVKEGNNVANFMANEGFNISKNFLSYSSPLSKIKELLFNDVLGICFPLIIRH